MSAAQKDDRKRDLARIHCLKKELALDDDTYRDMLWTVARVRSSAGLDAHGRRQVIEHMQSRRGGRRPARPSADRAGLVGKIEAQMRDLDVGERYIDGIAQRVTGTDRWRWCNPEQLKKVTAALWYAQERRKRKEGST